MDQATKSDQIADKCALANCSEAKARRHHQLYVFEQWDVHPPLAFISWHDAHGKGDSPVTAWNCASIRKEYNLIKNGVM